MVWESFGSNNSKNSTPASSTHKCIGPTHYAQCLGKIVDNTLLSQMDFHQTCCPTQPCVMPIPSFNLFEYWSQEEVVILHRSENIYPKHPATQYSMSISGPGQPWLTIWDSLIPNFSISEAQQHYTRIPLHPITYARFNAYILLIKDVHIALKVCSFRSVPFIPHQGLMHQAAKVFIKMASSSKTTLPAANGCG